MERDTNLIVDDSQKKFLEASLSGYEFLPGDQDKQKMMSSGAMLLKRIYGYTDSTRAYTLDKHGVCDLMNFLFLKAKNKKQQFAEGTYVLSDDEGKLFKALKPIGYERSSSHSIGMKEKQSKHYGIDLPVGETLHSNKRHLLFFSFEGYDQQQKLFLKPENHGLEIPSNFVRHVVEFATKTVLRECHFIKALPDRHHRKERLTSLDASDRAMIEDFKEWLIKHELLKGWLTRHRQLEDMETKKVVQSNINNFGLSYIYDCSCKIVAHYGGEDPSQQVGTLGDIIKGFADIKRKIEKQFDHRECRMAKEVIFDLQELGVAIEYE
ncbi:MAG: hypothetical protein AAF400_01105 [Bacteroidota bacterium]